MSETGWINQNFHIYQTIEFPAALFRTLKDDRVGLIFSRKHSIRIAFRNNRFGVAVTMRDILSGNEQEGEAPKGVGRRARAGKLISLYRECSQHEPYAYWLTSFHELKVSASRWGLRYRADYYMARYALEWEGKKEWPREGARKSGGEILMYTPPPHPGVLTSLKRGRLIAQSAYNPQISRNKATPRWIISIRGSSTSAREITIY